MELDAMMTPARNHKSALPATAKIARSCDHCKSKKIKCDQAKPSCANCLKYQEQCIYSVMKKPGLRAGYGQQVFERILELDRFIEENKSKHELENILLKEKLKSLEDKFESLEKKYAKLPVTPGHINNLELELMTSNPFARPSPKHIDKPASIVSPVVSTDKTAASAVTVPDMEDIPAPDKCEILVQLYFEYVNPLFPILHPQLDRNRLLDNLTASNTLLLGVLISVLEFTDDVLEAHERTGYFKFLKARIITECFAVKTIVELKTISLLAFTLFGKSNNHEAWSVVLLAVGGCVHHGLIKNFSLSSDLLGIPPDDETTPLTSTTSRDWKSWADKELLRRLVWEVYKLDKLSSMGSHFVLKLPQEEISTLLPLKLSLWEFKYVYSVEALETGQTRTLKDFETKPGDHDLYGSNAYIVEVLNIMGKCLRFRRSPMDIKDMESVLSWQLSCYEFDSKINNWKQTLPEPISAFLDSGAIVTRKVSVEDVILHCLFHTMIIRLHSPTAFSHFQDKYLISAQTSKNRCISSANKILQLADLLPKMFLASPDSVYELFGPYYAFAVWVSGRVILVNAIHSQDQLSPDFDNAIVLLRKIGKKWACACKYADILDFFKDDTMSIDTSSHDGTGDTHFNSNSYSEDAKLIADIKLNASSLDSLLSKKVARYKSAKGSVDTMSIFDWFKLPLNEAFMP